METKSGKQWLDWANTNAPNSNSLTTLAPDFRNKVEQFISALEKAGAKVKITATKRSGERAYLFHWAWLIATGKSKPPEAVKMEGVDIVWDHGDTTESVEGAKEMVKAFGLAMPPKSIVAPALNSNHISGHAIDMNITWQDKIKVMSGDGKEVEIIYQSDPNSNTKLIELGASYGVYKNMHDTPHWSFNGR